MPQEKSKRPIKTGGKLIVKKTLNEKNLPNLITFTNFCVLVYVPWWITSPVASQAPINDLHFMQQLFTYADVGE